MKVMTLEEASAIPLSELFTLVATTREAYFKRWPDGWTSVMYDLPKQLVLMQTALQSGRPISEPSIPADALI